MTTRLLLIMSFSCLAALRPVAAQEALHIRDLKAERHIVFQGGYFPRVIVLPNGDLLATFKYGAAHVGKGGKAGLARSTDGGKTWSHPKTIFDRPEADDGVIASGLLADGTVLLGAVSYSWPGAAYSHEGWKANPYILRSKDSGETWEAPIAVNVQPLTWGYPFGRILEFGDGSLLLSGYGGYLPRTPEDEPVGLEKLRAAGKQPSKPPEKRGTFSYVVRSRDGGKSWGDLTVIAHGFNETCMLPLKDGRLMAVMRSDEGAYLASSFSADRGRRWSEPSRITKDREHPGDLLRLRSGNILLTYGERNKPYGVQAMISADEGATWLKNDRVALAWDGDHSDIGYPVTIERSDGRLVTVYYVVYGERDSFGDKGIAPKNAFTKVVIWDPPRGW